MNSTFTYAYCPMCDKISEAVIDDFEHGITPDTPGRWAYADIVCSHCYGIIATLYKNLDEEAEEDHGCGEDGSCDGDCGDICASVPKEELPQYRFNSGSDLSLF